METGCDVEIVMVEQWVDVLVGNEQWLVQVEGAWPVIVSE